MDTESHRLTRLVLTSPPSKFLFIFLSELLKMRPLAIAFVEFALITSYYYLSECEEGKLFLVNSDPGGLCVRKILKQRIVPLNAE